MHYLEAETGAPSRERLWSSRPQGTRSAQCADAEVRGAVTDAASPLRGPQFWLVGPGRALAEGAEADAREGTWENELGRGDRWGF